MREGGSEGGGRQEASRVRREGKLEVGGKEEERREKVS